MKHTWKAALAVAALAASAGAAKADLTLDGQTGLFVNPTAEVVQKGEAEIAVNYQQADVDVLAGQVDFYGIGGAFGAADKLEISASYQKLKIDTPIIVLDDTDIDDWRIGGKYQLLNKNNKGFDLALGVNYERLGNDTSRSNHYTVYLAGTKDFDFSSNRAPIQGTLGLRWDRLSSSITEDSSKVSVYAGVSVPLTRDGDISLIGEIGTKTLEEISGTKAEIPYAVGLRYHPQASGFSAGVGFGRPNIFVQQEGTGTALFAQVGYAFGG